MSFIDNSYEIYINSAINKSFGDTTSDFTIYFQEIPLEEQTTYEISLSSIQIPNVIPQFHKNETEFKIKQGTTTYNFIYDNEKIFDNIDKMLNYVNTLINAQLTSVTIEKDTDTKKTKITNSSVDDIEIFYSPFFKKLGFNEDSTAVGDIITITASNNYITNSYASIIGTSRFYIVCEEIENNSFSGENYKNWSIMNSINVNGGFGNFINYQTNNLYYHKIKISGSINNFSFRVLDDQFRIVDLKNQGVQLSLVMRKK